MIIRKHIVINSIESLLVEGICSMLLERLLGNHKAIFYLALGLLLRGGVAGVLERYVVCREHFSQIFLMLFYL